MTIGGVKVLDDISFEGVKIPKRVCIGVCAGTANGHSNMMCVNNVKIKGEDRAEEAAVDCGDESSEDDEDHHADQKPKRQFDFLGILLFFLLQTLYIKISFLQLRFIVVIH